MNQTQKDKKQTQHYRETKNQLLEEMSNLVFPDGHLLVIPMEVRYLLAEKLLRSKHLKVELTTPF